MGGVKQTHVMFILIVDRIDHMIPESVIHLDKKRTIVNGSLSLRLINYKNIQNSRTDEILDYLHYTDYTNVYYYYYLTKQQYTVTDTTDSTAKLNHFPSRPGAAVPGVGLP